MARVFLDTCVLFPPRLRALVLGLADKDLFTPVWSAGVSAEWAHLCARRDPETAAALPALLSRMAARWPDSTAPRGTPELMDLPDPNDAHILAAAIAGRAQIIVTLNLRDFPARALGPHGLRAEHPDGFALNHWLSHPAAVTQTLAQVWPGLTAPDLRRALKKSGLPRLGKAMDA
jgi:predicted nucleic acid-binding protein